jgi:hypothetical protein
MLIGSLLLLIYLWSSGAAGTLVAPLLSIYPRSSGAAGCWWVLAGRSLLSIYLWRGGRGLGEEWDLGMCCRRCLECMALATSSVGHFLRQERVSCLRRTNELVREMVGAGAHECPECEDDVFLVDRQLYSGTTETASFFNTPSSEEVALSGLKTVQPEIPVSVPSIERAEGEDAGVGV